MKWLRRRRPRTVVIGTEMAAARSAETRHQQHSRGPSPLGGVSYRLAAGESDLFRFVDVPVDEQVASVVVSAPTLNGQALVDLRGALTQEDLYTLLTFARRATVRALRGQTGQLLRGWLAVGLVDLERVDWRDAAVATGLLSYAAARTNTLCPPDLALAVASPATAKLLRQYSKSGASSLTVGGYREVKTRDGPSLVEDYGHAYEPTVDLLAGAELLAEVIESDHYQLTGITTGSEIASVWLPAHDAETEQARKNVGACLSVSAAPRDEAATVFPAQTFLAYIAECASSEDASRLANAAQQPASSEVAELAVWHGRLCVVVIARSTVKDVAPLESTSSIIRFRDPVRSALSKLTGA
jgi:hypothetical protein